MITSAQEEERLRAARELHDDTIQALIALKQRVQLARKASDDAGAAPLLQELEQLAEGTIDNVRRMTRALRPIYLEDLGLVTALEMLTRETGQADGLQVEFERAGEEKRLNRETELTLYRIAQQAISNVVRHARAGRAVLKVTFSDSDITWMSVTMGSDSRCPAIPRILLQWTLRADRHARKGRPDRSALRVLSEPGRGTQVRVRLPLAPFDAAAARQTARLAHAVLRLRRRTRSIIVGDDNRIGPTESAQGRTVARRTIWLGGKPRMTDHDHDHTQHAAHSMQHDHAAHEMPPHSEHQSHAAHAMHRMPDEPMAASHPMPAGRWNMLTTKDTPATRITPDMSRCSVSDSGQPGAQCPGVDLQPHDPEPAWIPTAAFAGSEWIRSSSRW